MSEPKIIKIDEVEYVRKDSLPTYNPTKNGPWEIGEKYLIRTVTMINHGTLVDITENEIVLQNVSWIPDTGRFSDFVNKKISPNEVEPFPKNEIVIIGRSSLIDAVKLNSSFENQI
jgi:hypothetical protein